MSTNIYKRLAVSLDLYNFIKNISNIWTYSKYSSAGDLYNFNSSFDKVLDKFAASLRRR